jgi:hypothetical protein
MRIASKIAFGVIHAEHFRFRQKSGNGLQRGNSDEGSQ